MTLPAPKIVECSWHPQYFGRRQFVIKKRLPRGITDAEIADYVATAIEEGAVTHGMCGACKRKFTTEHAARLGRNRNGRRR